MMKLITFWHVPHKIKYIYIWKSGDETLTLNPQDSGSFHPMWIWQRCFGFPSNPSSFLHAESHVGWFFCGVTCLIEMGHHICCSWAKGKEGPFIFSLLSARPPWSPIYFGIVRNQHIDQELGSFFGLNVTQVPPGCPGHK